MIDKIKYRIEAMIIKRRLRGKYSVGRAALVVLRLILYQRYLHNTPDDRSAFILRDCVAEIRDSVNKTENHGFIPRMKGMNTW